MLTLSIKVRKGLEGCWIKIRTCNPVVIKRTADWMIRKVIIRTLQFVARLRINFVTCRDVCTFNVLKFSFEHLVDDAWYGVAI